MSLEVIRHLKRNLASPRLCVAHMCMLGGNVVKFLGHWLNEILHTYM